MGKIEGAFAFASNTPGMPTGYGTQAYQLIDRMLKAGVNVASLSNYGFEGTIGETVVGGKTIAHYPKGFTPYSGDVITQWFNHYAQQQTTKTALFTLYDVWVYEQLADSWKYNGEPIPVVAWTPLDHVSLPPAVASFLRRPNVTPVTMSPHGQRQLAEAGIESIYIPHAIDLETYKPRKVMPSNGMDARKFILGERKDDVFLVGMVSANKANGMVHRKSYAENFMAFSAFHMKHPDSVLYVHAEAGPTMGGFTLPMLAQACGLTPDAVVFADQVQLRLGFSDEDMSAIYTAMDILLHPNMGEGFGLTSLEAQACETPVITSSWAASADLVSADCYLVEGQPWWNEPMKAVSQVPLIGSIFGALNAAYDRGRMRSTVSREFAQQFDADKVFAEKWLPFLGGYFA